MSKKEKKNYDDYGPYGAYGQFLLATNLIREERNHELEQWLIKFPELINTDPGDGLQSLMHLAADLGHLKSIELLIKHGANVNLKNDDKQTPLARLILRKDSNLKLVELLLSHGANPQSLDRDRLTPLHYCAMYQRVEVAKLLISKGVRLSLEDSIKDMPLDKAIRYGYLDMVELLITAGAPWQHLKDKDGEIMLYSLNYNMVGEKAIAIHRYLNGLLKATTEKEALSKVALSTEAIHVTKESESESLSQPHKKINRL